jgi:hypothetical protein
MSRDRVRTLENNGLKGLKEQSNYVAEYLT